MLTFAYGSNMATQRLAAQGMRPYHWYKHHVLSGAREHTLPTTYIRALETIEALDDPDDECHQREMAIHASGALLAGAK